jgi:DNA-directed RNA polymerase specialized sigma subunit
MVQSQVNKYRSNTVPMSVLEAKADQILVKSAGSFRSGAGAKFKTYLFGNLRRLNRFSTARSNIATIPEARAQKIGVYQRVYEQMKDQKRRPPTAAELADELNWPLSEVMTMQRSVRMDIINTQVSTPPRLDTTDAKTRQLIQDIWWELTPDEKKVFELITGKNGKRKLDKGKDIAKATRFSQAKVSQLRKAIAKKMEAHL